VTLRQYFRVRGGRSTYAATMAAAITLGVPAIASAATTLQAESMSVISGSASATTNSAASGGKTMVQWNNGTISKTVTTSATDRVVVRAAGQPCDGAPSMRVQIDGTTVLNAAVSSGALTDYSATARLTAGSHTVAISYTNDFSRSGCDRNLITDSVSFPDAASTPTPTPTPAPSSPSTKAMPGYWSSSFENGAAEPTEWTTWGPAQSYGAWGPGQQNEINTPESFGVPRSPDNSNRVVKLYHPEADKVAIHHKLYKSLRATTWPSGAGALNNNGAPADVSGRYLVDLYIDKSVMNARSGAQIAQFKEEYLDVNGGYHNDSHTWVDYNTNADGTHRFNLNNGRTGVNIPADAYLGKWITLELRVYQQNRTELWIGGQLKDTLPSTTSASAGRRYYPPGKVPAGYTGVRTTSPEGITVGQPVGWIFGAGNYTDRESRVYLDNARLLPLSTLNG
jgi:hypothetical protein